LSNLCFIVDEKSIDRGRYKSTQFVKSRPKPAPAAPTTPQFTQRFVTILRAANRDAMGELVNLGTEAASNPNVDFASPTSLLSILAGLLGLGLLAMADRGGKNDDDDSGPGGGLMQPVA